MRPSLRRGSLALCFVLFGCGAGEAPEPADAGQPEVEVPEGFRVRLVSAEPTVEPATAVPAPSPVEATTPATIWPATPPVEATPPATVWPATPSPAVTPPPPEGPLEVVSHGCFVERGPCNGDAYARTPTCWDKPLQDEDCAWASEWLIRLNRPLAPGLDLEAVGFPEALESRALQADGSFLVYRQLWMHAVPGRHRFVLPAGLKEVGGSALAEELEVVFEAGTDRPPVWSALDGRQEYLALDASGPPTIPVLSSGAAELTVTVCGVEPDDLAAATSWARHWMLPPHQRSQPRPPPMPGDELGRVNVPVDGDGDGTAETGIDLSPWLAEGLRPLAVMVGPAGTEPGAHRFAALVQPTRMHLNAWSHRGELVVWATALDTGRPLEGVEVEVQGTRATTDGDGLARLTLATADPDGWSSVASVLVARHGADRVVLPAQGMSQGWSAPTPPDTWSWFVTDGQGSNKGAAHGNTALGWYRPGDEVRLKGWLNRRGPDGRLREIAPGALQVRWSVDPGGGPVRPFSFGAAPPEPLPLGPSGTAALSPLGGFHVRFTVPERVAGDELGVNLELEGDDAPDWGESFVLRVLAPAAPTVDVSMGGPTDRWIGESIELTARIRSPAGAPVEGEGLHWAVHATPARFAPPGWPGFSFGDGRPAVEASHDLDLVGAAYAEVATLDIDGGHSGGHRAILHLDSGRPAVPRLVQVRAQASVPGGWTPASWQTLVVHPAERTVGLFLDAPMVTAGEPVELRAVVVDLEGEPVPDVPVQVRVVPLSRGGSWTETGPELAGCDLVSGAGSVACELRIDGAGPHRVKAVVHGGAGRPSESWLTVHVANPSAEPARWPRVEVAPDREVYAARDRARLEIEAPARATFVDAPGLVLVAGLDGLQTLPFQLEGRRAGVEVPVPEQSCWLDVELVGHAPPEGADPGPNGIRWAATRRALEVPPDHLGLVVEVVPMLGTLNTMAVVVSDADGQPVGGAEVALFGVDDAILDPLRPPPDPLGQLHAPLYEGGLRPADSTRLAAAFAQPRGEARQSMLNDVYHSPCSAGHAPASKPPFEPGRCAAGPLFEPELLTSAEGVVEIELDPALMERGCRLLAVAAAPGGRYGAGLNGVGRR